MHTILLLVACTGSTPETDVVDTDVVDTAPPEAQVILFAADPTTGPAALWATWFAERWLAEAHAWDERRVDVPDDALVVFLPDLARDAGNDVDDHAKGGSTLGLGLGGAYAYEGMKNGLGLRNGGQGEVDALTVAEGHESHPIFAGISIPEDGIVAITTQPITDVGIRPADSIEVVAWDYRFPGDFGSICYRGDRAWYWGWGDAEVGGPPVYTDDGLNILTAIVDRLVPPR